MNLPQVILDTDILSALMRGNPQIVSKAKAYVTQHGQLAFSIITQYEILRGLKAKGAARQEENFGRLCVRSKVLTLSDEVVSQAAEIYANLYVRGELIGDADILIAASALANGLGVVTNNERHFTRITGLHVENWHR